MPRRGLLIVLIVVLAAAFVPRLTVAGGPFLVDDLNKSGKALRWQNDTLTWCVDEGALSSGVTNATAIGWVVEAFAKWSGVTLKNAASPSVSVKTTTFKAVRDTACTPGDIDSSNHESYTQGFSQPPTVIFDEDGGIIDGLLGSGASDGVVGLSYPGCADPDSCGGDASGLYMVKGGFAAFNGKMIGTGSPLGTGATAEELFKASMLHELGHLLNMDHAQVNFDIASSSTCTLGDCPDGNYIPTMYPELLTSSQGILQRDDMVTVSWIYLDAKLTSDFCTITGEIFDKDSNPLKGVNVIASSTTSETQARVDARAMVSGVMKPECAGDSRYYLYGIKPGVSYQVSYEPIGAEFIGYSDFEPLANPPQGFDSGQITTPGGDTTVKCDSGGQTIEMASVTIDTSNPCSGSGNGTQATTGSSTTSKCSLAGAAGAGSATLLEVMMMAAAAALLSRARRRA